MVYLDMAVSLDGFISGPNGEDNGLHDWYFSPSPPSQGVIDELMATMGAMVMGKRAFGGDEKAIEEGFDTPYKLPHYILTHSPLKSVERDGTSFHFITDGIESVLEQAKEAAGDKDVCVAGGANVAQQFLKAGLLDEVRLHVVSKLFGAGLRLFGDTAVKLERTQVTLGEGVTHLRFRVKREG